MPTARATQARPRSPDRAQLTVSPSATGIDYASAHGALLVARKAELRCSRGRFGRQGAHTATTPRDPVCLRRSSSWRRPGQTPTRGSPAACGHARECGSRLGDAASIRARCARAVSRPCQMDVCAGTACSVPTRGGQGAGGTRVAARAVRAAVARERGLRRRTRVRARARDLDMVSDELSGRDRYLASGSRRPLADGGRSRDRVSTAFPQCPRSTMRRQCEPLFHGAGDRQW